ncbi:Hypothetical protein NGAL_HAMBI2605_04320 [Neorhizobium galegae bv. orientalis]|nr:Hypothetical protein NGAL_HAMBI2605_04320 [Neorhizobium galegae bv. orientalis]
MGVNRAGRVYSHTYRSNAPPPAELRVIRRPTPPPRDVCRNGGTPPPSRCSVLFGKPAAPPPAAGFFVLGLRVFQNSSCAPSVVSARCGIRRSRFVPESRAGREAIHRPGRRRRLPETSFELPRAASGPLWRGRIPCSGRESQPLPNRQRRWFVCCAVVLTCLLSPSARHFLHREADVGRGELDGEEDRNDRLKPGSLRGPRLPFVNHVGARNQSTISLRR